MAKHKNKSNSAWPLAELASTNRNAVLVYTALRLLAKGRLQLGTTRSRIAEQTSLYKDTITEAMKALSLAGWISFKVTGRSNRRWYSVTFPCSEYFPCTVETRSREPQKVCTPKAGSGRSRERDETGRFTAKGSVPLGGFEPANSLKRVGASSSPAPTADAGAERTPSDTTTSEETPVDEYGRRSPNEPLINIADLFARSPSEGESQ